ncbi:MAG TPA: hypothetical protein VF476_13595 [Chitinophagaceae bacterium]
MKVHSTLSIFFFLLTMLLVTGNIAEAQQYKLRQSTSMTGMKSETTIYVKGMRKRTEGGGYMGMTNLVTIEQCDLQRTIKINDKKKLYYIEPFSKVEETEDEKPVKPVAATSKEKTESKTGGIIYMYYNIVDTGERKKMHGFTARHIWTTQKIKPSADACMMKDSMIIKTDGWYIDFPQFNCPTTGVNRSSYRGATQKPDCKDRYVSKKSGKGKLGFPLIEKKTMIMGGTMSTSEFVTDLETLELSTVKLDSMLFEIPVGYAETKNEEDLQDKFDISQIMNQSGYKDRPAVSRTITDEKKPGAIRVGVFEPTGNATLQNSVLQKHLVDQFFEDNIEAVAVSSVDDAKKNNCDLLLNTEFTKLKQGSKMGSLLKAIKNTDPIATTSFTIEAKLTLSNIKDGSIRKQEKISGKYDGKADDAAMKALSEGEKNLIQALK